MNFEIRTGHESAAPGVTYTSVLVEGHEPVLVRQMAEGRHWMSLAPDGAIHYSPSLRDAVVVALGFDLPNWPSRRDWPSAFTN